MLNWLVLLAVVMGVVAAGNVDAKIDPLLRVSTNLGEVVGHYNEVGIREWKGIPYAQPPVGDLRWEYPLAAKPYASGVYEANFNANGCPQVCKLPPGNCPEYGISEDCLYLTVFSPSKPSADPNGYPVHFWIHGGAFEQGLGNCALYNASTFAQEDVTSVVINYRLGVVGFLASPSQKGNYGLLDQRMALQWTRDNIRGFGGNPDKITIAGQSAGAMSVAAHMTSPNSKGMFAGAIMESNPLALPFHSRASAKANAKTVFAYVGCAEDDVACMRAKPIDQLLEAQENAIKLNLNNLLINFLPFAPMVETVAENPNTELPEQPFTALAKGAWTTPTAPLLAGSLYDEGQLFVYELFTKPVTKTAYSVIIDGTFGIKKGEEISKMYPFDLVNPGNETDARHTLNMLATDLLFYCPLRNMTRGALNAFAANSAKSPDVFIYRFKHVESFDCWGPDYSFCVGSCCHGSELPYVFNVFTDGKSVSYTPTADEVTLTSDISHAWTNFFHSGSPNLGKASIPMNYPKYEAALDNLLVLDEPGFEVQRHVREKYCDLWDRLGYYY
jgi:acetylcholinesterase/cholinesterase